MKRVTVKSFIAAVKKTGVVPKRCLWIRKGTNTIEACAIGALAVAEGTKQDARRWAQSAEGLGLTSEYVSGFIGGFDGGRGRRNVSEQYDLGREDGLACATAAFDEKLHEEYAAVDGVDMTPYLTPPDDDAAEQYVYTWN
jgi:hypothetical protein